MFELDQSDGNRGSASRLVQSFSPMPKGGKRALLFWGEHCTECAAPDCYKSCALYQPRPDGRCRRFVFGARENGAIRSATGSGVEIRFRRWGRLVARGNTALIPDPVVRMAERSLLLAAPVIHFAGRIATKITGDDRWKSLNYYLKERLADWLGRRGGAQGSYSLLSEIYNPGQSGTELLLTISVDRTRLSGPAESVPPPFQQKLVIPPGHSSQVIPSKRFAAVAQSGLPFEIALDPMEEDARLIFLRLDLVAGDEYSAPTPAKETNGLPPAKCVIFDLDETLWNGTLVEGAVELRAGIRDIFSALDERGILISVCSKNDHGAAVAKLRALGLADFLLHPQIGWGTKSAGVAEIGRALDIGTDSLIFIDDNPFERAQVEQAVPGVTALAETALSDLLNHPRLQGSGTVEARSRRRIYSEAGRRQEAAEDFRGKYADFLRSCEISAEIRPDRPEDSERIFELVQRTNQLNFSGHKYGREEVGPLLADPAYERYVIRCADRFGDYGLVGFCLIQQTGDTLRIIDMMLSCRVQGRMIERALFDHLVRRPGWPVSTLEVRFRDTERNGPASQILDELGFGAAEGDYRRRNVARDSFAGHVIRLTGDYAGDLALAG